MYKVEYSPPLCVWGGGDKIKEFGDVEKKSKILWCNATRRGEENHEAGGGNKIKSHGSLSGETMKTEKEIEQ